jgi:hypothetical protein
MTGWRPGRCGWPFAKTPGLTWLAQRTVSSAELEFVAAHRNWNEIREQKVKQSLFYHNYIYTLHEVCITLLSSAPMESCRSNRVMHELPSKVAERAWYASAFRHGP